MVERCVLILPSRDLTAALRFYEALGFVNVGTPPEEWDYLILTRGEAMVHLITDPTVDPLSTASSCYLYVDDVDSVYRSWQAAWPELSVEEQAAGARLGPPEDTAYGMREMGVVDPSGNLIRVGGGDQRSSVEFRRRDASHPVAPFPDRASGFARCSRRTDRRSAAPAPAGSARSPEPRRGQSAAR